MNTFKELELRYNGPFPIGAREKALGLSRAVGRARTPGEALHARITGDTRLEIARLRSHSVLANRADALSYEEQLPRLLGRLRASRDASLAYRFA